MLKNLKIATRLQIGFAFVLILALVMVVPVVNIKISDVVHEAERNELKNLYKSAMAEIESEGRLAQAMSYIIASMPEMSQAMAEGRRDDLAARTVPLFKELKKQYSVRQFQFHLPPAISFLRAHKAKKFGDDLSSFRKTILATNSSKKAVKGLEKGVAGLGIRGITPVFYDNQHIGSVEFGMSFGQAFFDKFKNKYGVDIALHIKRNEGFTPFGATLRSGSNEKATLLQAGELKLAMQGTEVITQAEFSETPYAIYGKSVTDFSGNPIGVMEIALNRSHYVAAIASARNITLLIGLLALAIGLFVAFIIGRTIVNPIKSAVDAMNDIAEGDRRKVIMEIQQMLTSCKTKIIIAHDRILYGEFKEIYLHNSYGDINSSTYTVSLHSLYELKNIIKSHISYAFIGHIFETDCKKGLKPKGVELLSDAIKLTKESNLELVALGGINRKTIIFLKEIEIKHIAIMSEWQKCTDIAELISYYRKLGY